MSAQPEETNDSPQSDIKKPSGNTDPMSDQSSTTNSSSPLQVEQNIKKSKVRICVTYVATTFIFLGGGFLITWFVSKGKMDEALNVFNIILPIAAGIVTYWFAARSNQKKNDEK